MKKEENKFETQTVVVVGIVTSARIGSTRFDENVKNRLSIKCEDGAIPYETIEKAYANVGSKLTPSWLKEKTGYINISSKFDIPCKTVTKKEITFETFTEMTTAIGSKIKLALTLKEGAIYPQAFIILEDGEEIDPFANLN